MNKIWETLQQSLTDKVGFWQNTSNMDGQEERPGRLKQLHNIRFRGMLGVSLSVIGIVLNWLSGDDDLPDTTQKEVPVQKYAELTTPLSSVADSEGWVNRIQTLVKDSSKQSNLLADKIQLLEKQNEELRSALLKKGLLTDASDSQSATVSESGNATTVTPSTNNADPTKNTQPVEYTNNASVSSTSTITPPPQPFPGNRNDVVTNAIAAANQPNGQVAKNSKKRKLLHLTNTQSFVDKTFTKPDLWIPSSSIFKVISLMGVAVSTSTNSSTDPQPLLLRIVDDGQLPGGLKSIVKDAVIIASCYGSISEERAKCRLKSLTWRDKQGRNIERPLKGWLSSEDGLSNVSAKIIDRSNDLAMQAMSAGMLSAASNFLKFEAQSSVFPASPFGQTRAMPGKDALAGAASSGASSALDRLAQYSIERMQAMSPVAVVNAGRILNAVLLEGVDISPNVQDPQLINTTSPSNNSSSQDFNQGDNQ